MDKRANTWQKTPTRIGLIQAALIAAIGLVLAACDTFTPGPTRTATPPTRVEGKATQDAAVAPKPAEATPKSAAPVLHSPAATQAAHPSPAPKSEPKPAQTVGSKGAEKLATPRAPAIAAVSEKPATKPNSAEPQPAVAHTSNAVASAPVPDLIVKGPPRPEHPRFSSRKVMIWIGLGLCGAVVAVLASLYVVRRPQPTEAPAGKPMDPLRADGILTKEPLEQP
jgi:hypothetical protein